MNRNQRNVKQTQVETHFAEKNDLLQINNDKNKRYVKRQAKR